MLKVRRYLALIIIILITLNSLSFAAIPGDANGDGKLDLGDVIIILQTLVGSTTNVVAVPAPTGLMVSAVSSSQVNMSWMGTAAVTSYKIYKWGVFLKSVTTTSASDAELLQNTNYCYSVSASDATGKESAQSSPFCVTTNVVAVPTPTGLIVSAVSSSQVNLTWIVSPGAVTGYKIYKGGTYLKSVITTPTSDLGLLPATNYCYSITAYNAVDESTPTSQLCAITLALPLSQPLTPTGFSVTPSSSSQIDLSWDASTETVTGYKVYRDGSLLKTIQGTVTSTSDIGLSPSTNYCYSITAYNAEGESGQASQICATVQAAPISLPSIPTNFNVHGSTSSLLDLGWTASSGTVAGYKLYRDGTYLADILRGPNGQQYFYFTDGLLSPNTTYCYSVTAYNSSGESAKSNRICATTPQVFPFPPITPPYFASPISGYVKTVDGIAIAGATVTLSDNTGFTFISTTTNSSGYYYYGSNAPHDNVATIFKVVAAGHSDYIEYFYFSPGQNYIKNITMY